VSFDGWKTHYRYLPAGPVSGDYCDLVASKAADGGSLYFLVGDVSGKGVAAAFVMAHLNALFRSLIDAGAGVGDLLERANRMLIENKISSHYATMVCGRAGTDGRIELGNAGHCPPLVLRSGGAEEVSGSGLPIGLFGGRSYTVSEVTLDPGETLVLYTDGLTEAADPSGAEFGAERLRALLEGRHADDSRATAEAVLDEAARHRAGTPPFDDITLLLLRRTVRRSGGTQ
jgi:sigma-B regulation protein RsbU (phosphoserine phosphatase)